LVLLFLARIASPQADGSVKVWFVRQARDSSLVGAEPGEKD